MKLKNPFKGQKKIKDKGAAESASDGKLDLPENYVAFVLPRDANEEPSAKDIEVWRKGTVDYITAKLKAQYPSFVDLKLQVLESEFGSKRPAPRFHLFLKIKADMEFSTEEDMAKVFESYISCFQEDYLEKGLRPLQNCSLKYAKEVRARRLGSGAGGAVTAPQFYLAFVCKETTLSDPTSKQKKDLLDLSKKEFSQLLNTEFEDAFGELTTLEITKVELNAGKPEPEYNLYIEFKAVASFTRDVPEPMDFFRPLASTSMAFTQQINQNIFRDSTHMVVRCHYVETLPELEPPPPGPQDDDEDGEPAEDGGGEDKEKKENETKAPTVKMELGFYVALVMQDLEDVPNNPWEMDELLHKFYTNALTKNFPDHNLVSLDIQGSPQYQAAVPLPRFNLLHPYDAIIEWEHPPPEGDDVLRRILYCDLPDLYQKIKGLPTPYNQMVEFTLGRALEQQVTDQAYGGTLDDEQKRKQEAARKAAEEKRKRDEAARKAAEEKRKREEEAARKAAEEKRKREEEAARKAAEEKRKREEEAARKAAEEKKRREEAEAARRAEEARKAEEARIAEEKRQEAERKAKEEAERKRKAEEERKERERKAAEAKAAREREEAERKRREEEAARKKAEAERKAKEEAERKERERKAAEAAAKKKAEEERKERERKAAEAKAAKEREEAERKRKEEEARKKAEAERKAKEEAERKRKEEAAKKKALRSSTTAATKPKAPAGSKRASMPAKLGIKVPEGPTVPVGTADVYVAFTIPNCTTAPTSIEYSDLAAKTQEFYAKHLHEKFPASFVSVDVSVSKACFGENKPNDKYNVYIEWDIKADFAEAGVDAPDRFRLCTSLVNIDLNGYVMKYVWALKGTPFEGARGVYTQQVNTWK